MDSIKRKIFIRNLLRDLRAIIRKQPLHEFLAFLSSLNFPNEKAWKIFIKRTENRPDLRKEFRIFIPSIAKYAILNSNDNVGESNRNFELVYNDVHKALSLIVDAKDWLPPELFSDPDQVLSGWPFLLANQQNSFQEFPKNTFARCFWLLDRIPNEIENGDSLNISESIETLYGFSLNKLWMIASARILHNYKGGYQLFNNESERSEDEEEGIKYFEKFSIDYSDFRSIANDNSRSLTGESTQFYGFSPFDLYPIIKSKDKFIVICPYYLVRRFYVPMYFDLMNHYQQGDDPRTNLFSSFFGKVFESYAGKQLALLGDGGENVPEFNYDSDGSKKFCDFSLVYGDTAILIEVKKNLLPVQAKFELDKAKLKESLEKNIVKGLEQIHKKLQHIESRLPGLERFENVTKYYPLVVTFDDTYQLNAPFIRGIINEALGEKNVQFENVWQIMTIRELENIVTVCNEENSFLSFWEKKVHETRLKHADFDEFLREENFVIGENELITQVIKEEIDKFNQGENGKD